MGALIEIVLPVFALVFLGYGAGRWKLMSDEAVKGLASFVYYLATPALVIKALATSRVMDSADFGVIWAYFGGTLAVFFITWLIGRKGYGLRDGSEGAMAMSAVFANTVLLGIPIVFTAYGDEGLVQLMLIITFHSALLMPLSIVAIEWGRHGGQGFGRALRSTLRLLVTNPVILSAIIGVGYGASGLAVPQGLERFLGLLGGASVPCALFALGASLAGFSLGGALGPIIAASASKLVLHPLLVGLLAFLVFDLQAVAAAVALITAALPTGVNVFIVAQQHGVFVARAASIVLVTTILAVPLLAVIITQLLPGL